jgi:lipopolysaccharide/colanic/teichoic acid biosynthesis glycosyltransferase/ribosomal protein S18 acetylase RimI-like enzyme
VSPLLLVVTIWLHFANKGAGAFFLQERPGRNGKIFKVIKYKTMTDERGEDGELLPDAQRLTKVGRFVRSTSIDELPQLINVLKGDMALIGPRPLLKRYFPFYSKEESLRHTVRPGITGWAQVHGRNTVRWDDRLALDVYYVKNLTMLLDIRIIFMTIKNVIKKSGIVDVPDSMFESLDDERKKKLSKEELLAFMHSVDKDFIPTLSEQAGDLDAYSTKLCSPIANLFFEKDDINRVKGVLAVYAKEKENPNAFITFVASGQDFRHQGVVRRLLNTTIEYCKSEGKKSVELFTHNPAAVELYKSMGFVMLEEGKMKLEI